MVKHVEISIPEQRLSLFDGGRAVGRWPVSTARKGAGERMGSECTPRGWHLVRAKIGAGCALGTVFVGRRATGEIYSPDLRAQQPGRDWILTRVIWLSGLERGRNRLGDVDTMRRYIYIHGMPDDSPCGVPASRGCINMRGADVIALFDSVALGTRVYIHG